MDQDLKTLMQTIKEARQYLSAIGEHVPVTIGGEQELDEKLIEAEIILEKLLGTQA